MTANPAKGGCETESDDDEDFILSQPRAGPSGRAGEVVTDEESTDEDDGASGSGSVPMKQLKQARSLVLPSSVPRARHALRVNTTSHLGFRVGRSAAAAAHEVDHR